MTFKSASKMKLSDFSSTISIGLIIKIFVNEYTSIMRWGLTRKDCITREKNNNHFICPQYSNFILLLVLKLLIIFYPDFL